jgi:hypothetical protein
LFRQLHVFNSGATQKSFSGLGKNWFGDETRLDAEAFLKKFLKGDVGGISGWFFLCRNFRQRVGKVLHDRMTTGVFKGGQAAWKLESPCAHAPDTLPGMKKTPIAMISAALLCLLFFTGAGAPPPQQQQPAAAVGWREMFREQERLERDKPDLSETFPGLAPEMARLGEAFAKTAYAGNEALGRKNFTTLVKNLGMTHPAPANLRQFLHPNKKPWPEHTGPTDGNFHMLFNTGTLNLDTADGSTKDHPARALAGAHLGFFTSGRHVKALAQTLSAAVRAEKADTAALLADPAARAAFMERFRAAWAKRFPKKKLSAGDMEFAAALLAFTA